MLKNKMFIGRDVELEQLIRRLKNLHNCTIIAPRRYGKTTLIHKAFEDIVKDSNFMVIEINLLNHSGGSIKSIAERIIEKCLNAIGFVDKLRLSIKQISLSLSLQLRYKDLELDSLIRLFKDDDKDSEWSLLGEALQLPERIAITQNKNVIVCYDEISEIVHQSKRIEQIFRSIIQHHNHVGYIFSGSQEQVITNMFIDIKSPFYRSTELIILKELSKEDVFKYMQSSVSNMPFDVFSEVMSFTNCHPYYVPLVIDQLHINKKYYLSVKDFYSYVDKVLIIQEYAYLELQVLRVKDITHALDVLRIIAIGLNPYEELKWIARPNLFKMIKWLEKMGYIRINGRVDYTLIDPLLRYFLAQYEYSI